VSVTAGVLWLSNDFRPVQEVGEEQHETNQRLVWNEQTTAVYSNLKWFEEKRNTYKPVGDMVRSLAWEKLSTFTPKGTEEYIGTISGNIVLKCRPILTRTAGE